MPIFRDVSNDDDEGDVGKSDVDELAEGDRQANVTEKAHQLVLDERGGRFAEVWPRAKSPCWKRNRSWK